MTLQAWCIACQFGQHDDHHDVPAPGTPGLIGSRHECPCRGECRKNARKADSNGFVFLTWEAALWAAHEGISTAYDYRRRVIVAAHEAGLSYQTIGDAIGLSAAGAHKIAAGRNVRGGLTPSKRQEQLLRESSDIPAQPEADSPSSFGEGEQTK